MITFHVSIITHILYATVQFWVAHKIWCSGPVEPFIVPSDVRIRGEEKSEVRLSYTASSSLTPPDRVHLS